MTREVARRLAQEPEVVNYQIYAGTAGPYNFNGLVRHYFLRQGANEADIQVNLLPKGDRSAQSHEISKRVRDAIVPIGDNTAPSESGGDSSRPARLSDAGGGSLRS